jgi:oligopeptide/dipeptide ABC transporter ATP-binding protein
MPPCLELRNLSVSLIGDGEESAILSDISLSLERGTTLIILGESGSGKTILTRALTRLFLPSQHFALTGEVLLDGRHVSGMPETVLEHVRRVFVRHIFQDPAAALNPRATVRAQLSIASGLAKPQDDAFEEVLASVGITDIVTVLKSFPHQLSIGMAQRVAIAMALLPQPALVVADEPTSSVDDDRREMILQLLAKRKRESNLALLVCTHDLGVARALGDRLAILLGGTLVESGTADALLSSPLHPYSQELLAASSPPAPDHRPAARGGSARPAGAEGIPGHGCKFAGRCPRELERCWVQEPPMERTGSDREVRCHFWR